MSSQKTGQLSPPPGRRDGARIYTLEVAVIGGPMSDEFLDANPVVSRTIVMPGVQTLEDLHRAIFDALGRLDEHMYEFQLGSEPMESGAPRYVMPAAAADESTDAPPAGLAPRTTLDDLGLAAGRVFFYWFDFGDSWWHSIRVAAVDQGTPTGEYPRVVARTGANPPQYADPDDEDEGRASEDVTFVDVDEDEPEDR